MTNIVTFSGWGQNYDSLENIAPGAKHINYKDYENIEDLFKSLDGVECDAVIGWSLGGQIALRALDKEAIKAKHLVLLSTPFQFVTGHGLKCGIDADSFNKFEDDFANDPAQTLKQFSLLISRGDENSKQIINKLKSNSNDALKWLYWLEELRQFSCGTMSYRRIPKTLAIIGREDGVVNSTQADLFRPLIKGYSLHVFDKCGHAPHLHNEEKVVQLIKDVV